MDISDQRSSVCRDLDPGASDGARSEQPVARGKVFFLARGGLRSLSRDGEPFMGHEVRDLFWLDGFDLIHEHDLPDLRATISSIIESPGSSSSIEVRLRDASGAWRWVEAGVLNVLEVPGDTGLLVVDLREHPGLTQPG